MNKNILLNDGQWETLDAFLERKSHLAILGAAGTGKSYVTSLCLKEWLKDPKNQKSNAVFAAPTHEALQQFKLNLEPEWLEHPQIEFMTVASLLSSRPIRWQTGERSFSNGTGDKLYDYNLVVVDEISMVPLETQIKLAELAERLVVMGDMAQLLPVKRKSGQIWEGVTIEGKFIDYKFTVVNLTEIVRNEGEILSLCTTCRTVEAYPSEDVAGIKVHRTPDSLVEEFVKSIVKASDPTNFLYLAYRNDTVNEVALEVHKLLYGEAPFVPGQLIRLTGPCAVGHNGSIARVLAVTPNEYMGYNAYTLLIENFHNKHYGTCEILSVDFETRKTIQLRIDQLINSCKEAIASKMLDLINVYHKELRKLEEISFTESPFALTVHKAQGRTTKNVFVNTVDISTGTSKKRLLYVAYSRASESLHTVKVVKPPKIRCMSYRQIWTDCFKDSVPGLTRTQWRKKYNYWLRGERTLTEEDYEAMVKLIIEQDCQN